jgi:predicted esterase
MDINYFETPRTSRYYTLKNSEIPIDTVLFVLHGYGMSAAKFLEEFKAVLEPGMMIVAPEGLSRYYRKGHSGDVVASWMTKDDREHEITDYVKYLDGVYNRVVENENVKSFVLGFSQGASTASRWTALGNCHHQALLIWAGEFAPEITQSIDNKMIVWNICGDQDEFIDLERHKQQTNRLRDLNFTTHEVVFKGRHQVDTGTVKSILMELKSISY